MNAPSSNEEAKEMLSKLAFELGEHFESVRIFATKKSDDGHHDSVAIDAGCGNLYAQYGQIWEWLEIQRGFTLAYAKKNWKAQNE